MSILRPDRDNVGHVFEVDQHALSIAHGTTH
jgi:hypothetical protein